jgi:threonine/homoserine/homoserine lactone efflux protein
MVYLQAFIIGFVISFIGSIPPGTLNLSVLQLGLEGKIKTGLRFALAVSIIEYPYAWIGVVFEDWITSTPAVVENFRLITAIVMTSLGILSLITARKPNATPSKFSESGFRRGIVLSILNPMAIPFWVAITAYFKAHGWIDLSTAGLIHTYVFATSVGAMALLTVFVFLANRLAPYVKDSLIVKLIPGIVLLVLGLYAFVQYLF